MSVEILRSTDNPMEVISLAAGTCYGKGDDYSEKRVRNCYTNRHMSVFEHASITFRAYDISRACTHQLVRHRLASYSQQSQRYCKIDVEADDWYVIPPWIEDDHWKKIGFQTAMRLYAETYSNYLKLAKPEDARYLLPEATKTEIVCTMNLREAYHFLWLRTSNKAQWEIRQLAEDLFEEMRNRSEQWKTLMDIWFEERGQDD